MSCTTEKEIAVINVDWSHAHLHLWSVVLGKCMEIDQRPHGTLKSVEVAEVMSFTSGIHSKNSLSYDSLSPPVNKLVLKVYTCSRTLCTSNVQ